MSTSGTYTFNPSLGELTLYAYNLAGLRNTSVLQEHMEAARMATNMMLSRWSNQGVNLWKVDPVTVALVQGQSTYTVDSNTVMILDAFMVIDDGNGSPTDRIITPVSRTEYASYPNKEQQGFTTTFWFDRLIRIEDAALSNGQTVDIPYLWFEAFADGLAYRLARVWNPPMAPGLKMLADESYNIAASQNIEQAQQYISPQISGYYRT